jgi:hypothetical protein
VWGFPLFRDARASGSFAPQFAHHAHTIRSVSMTNRGWAPAGVTRWWPTDDGQSATGDGAILGKALQPLDTGRGMIAVLVTLR